MAHKVSSFCHFFTKKITDVEGAIHQISQCFKELIADFEQICIEKESYKSKYLTLKQKTESNQCTKTDTLIKEIDTRDNIIQQVASGLTTLLETKDSNTVENILRIINPSYLPTESPKKQIEEKNASIQDESISEIEGTPTGRTSPIIQSRKLRNITSNGLSLNKKRSPNTWETPEKKSMKLQFPSPSRSKPGGRLKQSRLNLVKVKSSSVVDLTCSPETLAKAISCAENDVKCNVKKEVINDETILPSPTSAFHISQVFPQRSIPRNSAMTFKKPSTPLKFKIEKDTMEEDSDMKNSSPTFTQQMDIAKHCKKNLKLSPKFDENIDCDIDNSISLLPQKKSPRSPQKGTLLENNNVLNMRQDIESSMSILQRNVQVNKISPTSAQTMDKSKRKVDDDGPICKEPKVRKKSEKRALRGWSCSECRDFYGELYKDNPQMLELKMDECSKHRGKNNPIRAKTPPGFWDPRWDVPDDTEEFNRRNNAV